MANPEDFDIDSFLADARPGKDDAAIVDSLTGGPKANPFAVPEKRAAAPKRRAKGKDDFDIDGFLANYGKKKAEGTEAGTTGAKAPSFAVPMTPSKVDRIRDLIERGKLKEPSWWEKAKAAFDPSEVAGDVEAAVGRTYDRATAGVLPKVMEATGLVAPGRFEQLERERPIASAAGEFPAAAATMVTGAPQLAGKAAASIVGGLGGKTLPAAARTIAEGTAAGGLFGASDQAIRSAGEMGGKEGPVTAGDLETAAKDVGVAGGLGAATGGLMSALPGALSSVEDFAHRKVLANDLRPIKQMAKKGTLDKSLLQFGKDDPEEGARAMAAFVDKEELGPVFRKKGTKMDAAFNKRMDQSWREGAGPIIDKAFDIEPNASESLPEIADKIRALAPRGTPESLLINKAIARLGELQADAGMKGGKFPLKSLLETARAFQAEGHAGVVNYDEPTANKEMARRIGHELKALVNDRIGRIYAKHPDAARELLSQNPDFNEPGPPKLSPKKAKTIAEALLTNEDVAQVGQDLREGNARFSDFAKMRRMVGEVAKLKAGEKNHGLIGHVLHATGLGGAAALAGTVAGPHGILPAMAAYEGGRLAYPYAMRGIEGAARFGAGVPVDPGIRLTAPQLQAWRDVGNGDPWFSEKDKK